MIIVIGSHNAKQYHELIDQMYRLRARVFSDRLRWDVKVIDGRERDKYDDESPVYLIYADDTARELKASLRLLPTTGPTLLTDFFWDTRPEAAHLTSPTIWGCTRFCVNQKISNGKDNEQILVTTATMIAAVGELAMRAGIESILCNINSTMLRLCRRAGCEVQVLGATDRYGEKVYLGLLPISETILVKVRERLNMHALPTEGLLCSH